jgi:MFS transporter, ACS family, tartrate transporter
VGGSLDTGIERVVLGKVTRRLIPFLFVLYIFNFLDRTNVSVAALTMKPDLGLSDAVYGTGAGIFFLGYFFLEVPSNLILQRLGARVWMARIMVTWGIISSATMFVRGPTSFYTMRFLLGVAEAGFFPGMIFYLTQWFPAAERAKALSRFMLASSLAGVLGGPLSAALLKLNGVAGLKGWQWIFLAEGLPSVVLGIITLLCLTDRPAAAGWLSAKEREWLIARLQRDQAHREQRHGFTLWQAFAHPQILLLCGVYLTSVTAGYGVGFWTPLILKSRSTWPDPVISVVASIPGLIGAIGLLTAGVHSDRSGERRWHVAAAVWVGATGVVLGAWAHSAVLTLAAFSLASLGMASALGPFWAMSTSVMSGTAAAGAIAYINCVGNLGGFVGPSLMGHLKEWTGSFTPGLCLLAASLLLTGVLALLVRHDPALDRAAASAKQGGPDAILPDFGRILGK